MFFPRKSFHGLGNMTRTSITLSLMGSLGWMQFNGQTPWGTMTIAVRGEMTARELMQKVTRVEQGEIIRDVNELSFRHPSNFRAGELHAHYSFWEKVVERCPKMAAQTDVLDWVKNKVSIFPYFQHFRGSFKGEQNNSDRPPHRLFKKNMSWKPFVCFVQETLINHLGTGRYLWWGELGRWHRPILYYLWLLSRQSPASAMTRAIWISGWRTILSLWIPLMICLVM